MEEFVRKELLPFLPDVTLDTVTTEAEAFAIIDLAKAAGSNYDVAILDIMLPANTRSGTTHQTNIESYLASRMPDAKVFNISGNIPKQELLDTSQQYEATILTKEKEGMKALVRRVRGYLHGKNVSDSVNRLTTGRRDPDLSLIHGRSTSLTKAIQEAELAVLESWPFLADAAKDEVRKRFDVEESDNHCIRLPRLR